MADTVALNVDRHRLNNLQVSTSGRTLTVDKSEHKKTTYDRSAGQQPRPQVASERDRKRHPALGRREPPELDLEAC